MGLWASWRGSVTFRCVWGYVWLRLGMAVQFLIPGPNASGRPPPHGTKPLMQAITAPVPDLDLNTSLGSIPYTNLRQ